MYIDHPMHRLLPCLLGLMGMLSVSLVQAQPVPDTLDWRRYFPLEVGNQWHYASYGDGPLFYMRYHILADTLVFGTPYFVLRRTSYDENKDPDAASYTYYVRYADLGAYLATAGQLRDGTFVVEEGSWSDLPCGIDAPLRMMGRYPCAHSGESVLSNGDYGGKIVVVEDTVSVAAIKTIRTLRGSFVLATDLGMVGFEAESSNNSGIVLVYTRLHGKSYGMPVVPTAVDPKPELPATLAITSIYPNPFHTRATVDYTVREPAHVTLEVYNVLGQRIVLLAEEATLPGLRRFAFDGTGLATGIYFIRLTSSTGGRDTRAITLMR